MEATAAGMKGLLKQLLDQGPPAEWDCPPPVETLPTPAPVAQRRGRGKSGRRQGPMTREQADSTSLS